MTHRGWYAIKQNSNSNVSAKSLIFGGFVWLISPLSLSLSLSLSHTHTLQKIRFPGVFCLAYFPLLPLINKRFGIVL